MIHVTNVSSISFSSSILICNVLKYDRKTSKCLPYPCRNDYVGLPPYDPIYYTFTVIIKFRTIATLLFIVCTRYIVNC